MYDNHAISLFLYIFMGMLKKLEKSEEWQKYAAREKEKRNSIKSGESVMHLDYYSWVISQDDLDEYEKEFVNIGLQFGSYDKNGQMSASLEDLSLITALCLSQITVQAILEGTLTNAVWDTIKMVTLNIWRKSKGKHYTKMQVGLIEKMPISFGIKAQLDENTSYEFELNGNFSDEATLQSMDKILTFLKEQSLNQQYKFPFYTKYDEKTGKWNATDIEAEVRKRVQKQSKKRK